MEIHLEEIDDFGNSYLHVNGESVDDFDDETLKIANAAIAKIPTTLTFTFD